MNELNFQIFVSVIILAFLVESLVNVFKYIYNEIFTYYIHRADEKELPNYKSKHYLKQMIQNLLPRILAISLGIFLAFFTEKSIMELLHIPIKAFNNKTDKVFEFIITGLLISRGSNEVYDLIKKIKKIDKIEKDDVEDNRKTISNGVNNDSTSVKNENNINQ